MRQLFKKCWQLIRRLSGEDAYEEYLKHYAIYHAHDDEPLLSRKEFYKVWQEKKWQGVKRCC